MDKNERAHDESKAKTGNVTLERLQGLPFRSASAHKDAREEVRLRVWRRLEEARSFDELSKREEYQSVREEFRAGFFCVYGEDAEVLVRVYKDDEPGIKIAINRDKAVINNDKNFLTTMAKALSESFAATYYRVTGVLPTADPSNDESTPHPKR